GCHPRPPGADVAGVRRSRATDFDRLPWPWRVHRHAARLDEPGAHRAFAVSGRGHPSTTDWRRLMTTLRTRATMRLLATFESFLALCALYGGISLIAGAPGLDRKSTRLNSSHLVISYAVFCLKKKNTQS